MRTSSRHRRSHAPDGTTQVVLHRCPCCADRLVPIADGDDYRYVRCLDCGRVYVCDNVFPGGAGGRLVRNPVPHASQLQSCST